MGIIRNTLTGAGIGSVVPILGTAIGATTGILYSIGVMLYRDPILDEDNEN